MEVDMISKAIASFISMIMAIGTKLTSGIMIVNSGIYIGAISTTAICCCCCGRRLPVCSLYFVPVVLVPWYQVEVNERLLRDLTK